MGTKSIRTTARARLSGNAGAAFGVLLFPIFVLMIGFTLEELFRTMFGLPSVHALLEGNFTPGTIPASPIFLIAAGVIAVLVLLVLTAPVLAGCMRWFFLLGEGRIEPVSQTFYFFGSMGRCRRVLYLTINIGIKTLLLLFVGAMPGILLFRFVVPLAKTLHVFLSAASVLIASFVTLYGLGVAATAAQRYFLVFFLMDRPDLCAGEVIRLSAARMRGHRLSVMLLFLRFLPALVSCILLVPAVFVLPQFLCSLSVKAAILLKEEK